MVHAQSLGLGGLDDSARLGLRIRDFCRIHTRYVPGSELPVFVRIAKGEITEATLGLGEHFELILPANRLALGMVGWMSILWYALSLMLSQLSVLLLYIRVIGTDKMRRICYITMTIVTAFNFWILIYVFTACVPLQAFWDPTVPGRCYPVWVSPVNTVIHIATDLVIFLLPFPVVKHLRMPPRQKYLVFCIFGLGFL